jgi:hypothetical protein
MGNRKGSVGTAKGVSRKRLIIADKTEGLSFLKIGCIALVRIGLPFKTEVAIGLVTVTVIKAPDQPFRNIQEVKRKQQQFLLLPEVNSFVVDENGIRLETAFPQENKRPNGKPHIISVK